MISIHANYRAISKPIIEKLKQKLRRFKCPKCKTIGLVRLTGRAMEEEYNEQRHELERYPFIRCTAKKCNWAWWIKVYDRNRECRQCKTISPVSEWHITKKTNVGTRNIYLMLTCPHCQQSDILTSDPETKIRLRTRPDCPDCGNRLRKEDGSRFTCTNERCTLISTHWARGHFFKTVRSSVK